MKLDQATGLEARRNEHKVSARGDVVSHGCGKLDDTGGCAREFFVECTDGSLELLLSSSENDDLCLPGLQYLRERLDHDVHALLLFQAPNEPKQRHCGVHGEAGLGLQQLLRGRFSGDDGCFVVLHVEELILSGVPLTDVHAVHNPFDTASRPDSRIQLDALLLVRAHLGGVVGRHGEELVRGGESCLKPVNFLVSSHFGIFLPNLVIRGAVLVEDLRVTVLEGKPLI
mmetsp:Transcript_2243/g.3956  ORF Transcript_2243/g.3956 Transcript_2243/m.3956 type:complete len:228 (+) Transcript_2243:501-1184(+)